MSDLPTQEANEPEGCVRTDRLPPVDLKPAETEQRHSPALGSHGSFTNTQRGNKPPSEPPEPPAWAVPTPKQMPRAVDTPTPRHGIESADITVHGDDGGRTPDPVLYVPRRPPPSAPPTDPVVYVPRRPPPPPPPADPVVYAPLRPLPPRVPCPDRSTRRLLRQVRPPPSEGWRRWCYVLSGKLINFGESPRVNRFNGMATHIRRPLRDCYRIALLSLNGGVGKTTVTATLGATFASVRTDRVVAVDANPDRGTLTRRVPQETAATVRHLLRDAEGIQRYGDVRGYTSRGPSRLEVLASETDPARSAALGARDYSRVLDILERFYSVVLTDCGTGLLHPAMPAVLAKADILIVLGSASVDGARSAAAMLDWLNAHGYEHLAGGSITVMNAVQSARDGVDMRTVVDHFSPRCRAVRLVPFDPHLAHGGEVRLERLNPDTREAFVELAAVASAGFVSDPGFSEHFI